MEIKVERTWNGLPVLESEVVNVCFSFCAEKQALDVEIEAPFYDDTPPNAYSGSVMGLWEYEVVELFFLGDRDTYLELEFGPHNHFLVLQLQGKRNVIKDSLPLNSFQAQIDGNKWRANISIPLIYFPKNVQKFNVYAIHGKEPERTYLSLFPTPFGKYSNPDFHRLEYFGDFTLKNLFNTET